MTFNSDKLVQSYLKIYIRIIYFALQGKYENVSEELITHTIDSHQNKNSIPEFDIHNQYRTLCKIETEWKKHPITLQLIKKIHALSYLGNDKHQVSFRSGTRKSDIPFNIHTSVDDILPSLQNLVKKFIDLNTIQDEQERFSFLAEIFLSIISIHPFEDGNGRVARFLINLILRKWGMNYMIIPKVRNDPAWLKSLNESINDKNFSRLIPFFRKWYLDSSKYQ